MYFNFLLDTSSKYLAVTEVNPTAVVRQASPITIANIIVPVDPKIALVIFISNVVCEILLSYKVEDVAPKNVNPP